MTLDLSALDAEEFPVQAPGTIGRAALDAFDEDPGNPRFEDDPESFKSLMEDIRRRGILQPVVVRRAEDGRLSIRFGARRFRAAKALELSEVPFVVTEDPRQFDDYAQVSENEKRQPLQPLELATFIARKLAKGEKKKEIAAKLGLSPTTVTFLLSLLEAPAFVLDLYHSGRCRSPQYLYELRKFWEADSEEVERRCGEVGVIDRNAIDDIGRAPERADALASAAGASAADKDVVSPAADLTAPGKTPPGEAAIAHADRARGRAVEREACTQIRSPDLLATYCGRKVSVELTCGSAFDGNIVVRDAAGLLWEVPAHAIRITALRESA